MLKVGLLIALLVVSSGLAHAAQFDRQVPLKASKAATLYVGGYVDGFGAVEMMVDTGSSYTTINEATLKVLRKKGVVTYVKDLAGIMADGTRKVVPIYSISSMSIGKGCLLHDVEAAVFPGHTRSILGLSALKLAAPFAISLDPPTLVLSNCTGDVAHSGGDSDHGAASASNLSMNTVPAEDGQAISRVR